MQKSLNICILLHRKDMEADEDVLQFIEGVKETDSGNKETFPESLLNAERILKLSAKPSVLPNLGGEKGFEPNSVSLRKTAKYYDELSRILDEERVCRIGSLSKGKWEPSRKLVEVQKAAGSFWQKFGTAVGGILYALPEECLFLVEQGVFELYLNDLPLSVEESWILLSKDLPSLEYYTVYASLCRQGFAIVSSRRQQCLYEAGLIDYEDLRVMHSPKKYKGTRHGTSDNHVQLEKSFSQSTPKFQSCLIQTVNTLSSVLDSEVITSDDEVRSNSSQNIPPHVPCEYFLTKGDEQSIENTQNFQGQASHCDRDNMPLVSPQDAVSIGAVMKKLQIIQPRVLISSSQTIGAEPAGSHFQSCPLRNEAKSLASSFEQKSLEKKNEDLAASEISCIAPFIEPVRTSASPGGVKGNARQLSAEAPVALDVVKTPCKNLTSVPSANSFVVEEEMPFTGPLPSDTENKTGKPFPRSAALSDEGYFLESTEKEIVQNRMQVEKDLQLVRNNFGPVSLSDLPAQASSYASSSKTALEATRKSPFLDVYVKAMNFKKSDPGLPDCRVFPCSYKELPQNLAELDSVFECGGGCPVIFGVCEQGSVTFYSMNLTSVSDMLSSGHLG